MADMSKLQRDLVLARAASIWSRGHLAPTLDPSKVVLEHNLSAPAAKRNNFVYEPLDERANEIRLLRLCHPPEVDGQICCMLEHVSLDAKPVYEALSYTWADAEGDSSATDTLILEGRPVAITHNLNRAIRNIFLGKPETAFWVDALCIHQIDVVERSSQIGKMKDIFEKAGRVNAWLGDEHNNSKLAFQTLRDILVTGVQEVFRNLEWERFPDLEEEAHQKALSLVMLFRRSYWARLWIVQEAALAKDLILYCGSDTLAWATMENAVYDLRVHVNFLLEIFMQKDIAPYIMILAVAESAKYLFSFRAIDPNLKQACFGSLLVNNRYKLCTDPRDKVYGLLGLASSKVQEKLAVRYDRSTAEVYIDATTLVIEEEKDFSVVVENKRPRAFDRTADMHYGLPTWVSNFHNKYGREHRGLISQFSDAWRGAAKSTTLVANIKHRVLTVRGIKIGHITALGNKMPEYITFDYHFPPVIKTLYQWWLIYLSIGGKTILGDEDCFVNVIKCGDWYRKEWRFDSWSSFSGEKKAALGEGEGGSEDETPSTQLQYENEIRLNAEKTRYCLNIVMGVYEREDKSLRPLLGPEIHPTDPKEIQQAESNIWLATMTTTNRRFMAVGSHCGLAPMCAEVGDIIVVVLGSSVPIVLRERATSIGGGYLNIGDAYLHGFMEGRAVEDLENGVRVTEDFEIH